MSPLDWLQRQLGGQPDQGAPMAVQNPQGGFDPYQPAPSPDAMQILKDMTGATDIGQTYNAYQRGEYLPALGQGAWGVAQAAGAAIPALKAGGAALKAGAPLAREAAAALPGLLADETGAIRAWHASPYDFNKFDINKVGTGQGAQSYGHGIYAAESPAVSGKGGQYDLEFTAKNLGKYDLNPGELQIHRMLRADRSDMDILGELARGGGYTFDEAMAALERVKGAKAKIYEVDLNADPSQFLNLDKSLGGQSPSVLQALQEIGTPQSMLSQNAGEAIRRAGENPIRAADFFNRGGAPVGMTPADVSARLREAGIPGSRYLDQGSRGAAVDPAGIQRNIEMIEGYLRDPKMHPTHHAGWQKRIEELQAELVKAKQPSTSNYVIFDPKIIEILRKYGILPPAVAAGGLLGGGSEPPT